MTTIPLTPRNTPLTPVRIVEALCAANTEFRLGEDSTFQDLHGDRYLSRNLEWYDGINWAPAGAYISEPILLSTSSAVPPQLHEDTDVGVIFDRSFHLAWRAGWRMTVTCEPGPTQRCSKAICQAANGEITTAVADHPGLATLLAYAQMVSGLQLGEAWR